MKAGRVGTEMDEKIYPEQAGEDEMRQRTDRRGGIEELC